MRGGQTRLYDYCLGLPDLKMRASEYIESYIQSDIQPFAEVILSAARKGTHLALRAGDEVPEPNELLEVFIKVDVDSLPPVLIADHTCMGTGLICNDHSDQPYEHMGCYGTSLPCPYPGCLEG